MPLNCEYPQDAFSNPVIAFTGHDVRFVIGAVTKAWIDGDNLMCSGIVYRDNFPDIEYMMQNAKVALGFSVELYPLEHEILDDGYDHVTKLEFTGLTTAWKSICAFEDTWIQIAATAKRLAETNKNTKEVDAMDSKEMKEMFEGFLAKVDEKITASNAKLEEKITETNSKLEEKLTATVTPAVAPVEPVVNPEVEALKATQVELEAKLAEANAKLEATQVPAPTATQTAAPKDDVFDVYARIAEIDKMACSISERAKLRTTAILTAMANQK